MSEFLKKVFIVISILLATTFVNGQNNCNIQGEVLDSLSKVAIDRAFIIVQGNKIKEKAFTTQNGHFKISGLTRGNYEVQISKLGYKAKTIIVSATEAIHNLKIYLSIQQLREVIVSASRNLITQEIDRTIYSVKDDPDSKSVSIFEILRKTPFISIDADDKIKLKGQSNFKILINGRPSNILSRSPEEVLQIMPASNILRIEVITTPPGRFESEGMGGVINIVTIKRIDDGYNGSLAASHNTLRSTMVTNIMNVKMGRTAVSSNIGNAWRKFPGSFQTSSRNLLQPPSTSTIQNSESNSLHGTYRYSFSDLSYELDSLSLLSATIGVERSVGHRTGQQSFSSSTPVEDESSFYSSQNIEDNGRKSFETSLNYQRNFRRNKEDLLNIAYQYSDVNYNLLNRNNLSKQHNYNLQDYNQNNKSGGEEQTFQTDYSRKITKMLAEMGVKYIHRENYSDFIYESLDTEGNATPNANKSRSFAYVQSVYSAYNSYYLKLKSWGIKGGLRFEKTTVMADYISSKTSLNRKFNNLFPSMLIQHNFKRYNSIDLRYSQRIQRPGIWELNPFENQSNPIYYSSGNPDLDAALTHNFALGYSNTKKGFMNVSLDYSRSDNSIQNVIWIEGDNITRSKFYNIGKNSNLGISFNGSYPFSKSINARTNTSLSYLKIEGVDGNFWRKNSGLIHETNNSLNVNIKKTWRTTVTIGSYSNSISLQGKSNSFIFNSFSLSKPLLKKQATIFATVNNPFIGYRKTRSFTSSNNFNQSVIYQSLYRGVSVAFSYRFGRLKEQMKKTKKKVENNDVSNENKKIE